MESPNDLIVQHRSMADEVTERTRRLILSRQLQPGQRVRQTDLAEMMGVSTMPVREALLRLVAEGMILTDSNKSFTVAMTTTPDGIRDVYWIHSVLAGELAARAWDARDDELLATMNRHHETYIETLEAGSSGREAELFAENWAFHSAIHHKANSPAIALAVKNTLRYFPDFSLQIPGWYEVGAVWQAQLIRQFEKGTREGARNAVASGSSKSAELYIASLWPGEARGVEAETASPIGRSRGGASASKSKRTKPGTRLDQAQKG
jgi:DNA-binding GntR family transcriptional regulator